MPKRLPVSSELKQAIVSADGDLVVDSRSDRAHITCGDIASTSLKRCGVSGQRLPWKDLLLIGPLPLTKDYQNFFLNRAKFIKEWTQLAGLPTADKMAREDQQSLLGTLSSKSIVFWIWPMLSNHTMFLCLLDWYRQHNYQGELLWVDASKEIGRYDEEYIDTLIGTEKPISDARLSYAYTLWEALRQPSPERLLALLKSNPQQFPHMNTSFWRYLEELPCLKNGLSLMQQRILEAIQEGNHSPREIYSYAHQNERYFMAGDWYFWYLIVGLASAEYPLIETKGGENFVFPPQKNVEGFNDQVLHLTDIGREVLAGQRCQINTNGNKRSWGGIAEQALSEWRYDKHRKVLGKMSRD